MSVVSFPQGQRRPLTEHVAEEVRALMARRGVTQMDLVKVLHVSQTGVSKRLRGLIPFDANEIGLVAEFFDVDPADLLPSPATRPGPDGGAAASAGTHRYRQRFPFRRPSLALRPAA